MKRFAWSVAFLLAVVGASLSATGQPFDVIIRNGRILDGSGNPWFRADVGAQGGRITAVGMLEKAAAVRTIDARDLMVSPGFIDMMAGESLPLVLDRASAGSKLLEGVTTILVGEGDSPAPQSPDTMRKFHDHSQLPFSFSWTTYADYFDLLAKQKIALNVIHDVGAAQVREVVLGDRDIEPSDSQLKQMQLLVADAMQQGCIGVSTALIYPPGSYAKTTEIVSLAKVAAGYGGIYLSHIRNESSGLLDAIGEAIQIGREAHIPVHIYHLKAAGQENWHLVGKALDLIEQARSQGIDVTADAYPYIYNGIDLSSFIGPWHFAAGRESFIKTLSDPSVRSNLRKEIETRADWENWYMHVGRDWGNVLIADVPKGVDPAYAGMSIEQVAQSRRVDSWTAFFDLVGKGNTTVSPRSMNEDQKREIYSKDFVSISSDSPPSDPALEPHTHPRAFGTFPRILAKYVREDHVMTLPNAIRAMTSLPADQLRIADRGRLAVGMAADIVIFDAAKIQDTATYSQPASYPVGIQYVLVNGQVGVENGKLMEVLAGEVVRRAGLSEKNASFGGQR